MRQCCTCLRYRLTPCRWIVLVGSSVITGIVWRVWGAMRAEKAAELRAAYEAPTF